MNVYNVFLQRDLYGEIYTDLPQEFRSQGKHKQVCRLSKFLYGFNQAPRQCNAKLSEALTNCGFKQIQYDHSLFTKRKEYGIIIVLVYLDDILITGDNLEQIIETKATLHKDFK